MSVYLGWAVTKKKRKRRKNKIKKRGKKVRESIFWKLPFRIGSGRTQCNAQRRTETLKRCEDVRNGIYAMGIPTERDCQGLMRSSNDIVFAK